MADARSSARLLVVDPEDVLRVLIARILRDCGYDVVEAANGRVALELLNATPERHFDLIVTNSKLPGMDGFAFIQQVLERYPHLRVVHVSGHPESLDDQRLDALDRVYTLPKPFHPRDLTDAVERCLEAGLEQETAPPRAAGDAIGGAGGRS
jgi:two-component system, cell cycle sensor histidine kinase and response regulator CckA